MAFRDKILPAPRRCEKLLARLNAADVAMFRFLLEAHDNLAQFTALERKTALLKVFFPEGSRQAVIRALEDMRRTIDIEWQDWPT